MKTLLIVNPCAGRGRAGVYIDRLTELFEENGMEVTAIPTTERGEAQTIAEREAPGYDTVVCAGGDGTLHEVASGLMSLPNPPKLGYIPAGTTNDVAHGLGLPTNAIQAGKAIVQGRTQALDIGRFEDRFFVYVASFGSISEVSYTTNQDAKNRFGRLAYLTEGAMRLGNMRSYPVRIEYDAGVLDEDLLLLTMTNTARIGGIVKLGEDRSNPADGLFEMLIVRQTPNPFALMQAVADVMTGNFEDSKYVSLLHTSQATITSTNDQPIEWALDGEYGGQYRTVHIKNYRQVMEFIA